MKVKLNIDPTVTDFPVTVKLSHSDDSIEKDDLIYFLENISFKIHIYF